MRMNMEISVMLELMTVATRSKPLSGVSDQASSAMDVSLKQPEVWLIMLSQMMNIKLWIKPRPMEMALPSPACCVIMP